MGTGIVQLLLVAGCSVRLYDPQEAALQRARAALEGGLRKLVHKGALTPDACEQALTALSLVHVLDELAGVEAVIEAAPEDLGLKRSLLAQVAAVVAPTALLASNTSSLSISALAAALPEPGRVLGLHFFNPVHAMPLVEVVRGDATSPEAFSRAWALIETLGKRPIACADTPGFIVNRVARGYYGEALRLVGDHGAEPEAVDRACTLGLGFKLGPCALMDLIGLDVNLAVSTEVWRAYYHEPRFAPHPLQRRMVDAGRLGRKTGCGFYRYPAPEGASNQPEGENSRPLRLVFVGNSSALDAWARPLAAAGHQVEMFGDNLSALAPGSWDGAFEIGDASPAVRSERRLRVAACLPGDAWIASDDLAVTSTAMEVATGRVAWRFSTWPGGPQSTAAGIEVAFAPHCASEHIAAIRTLWASLGREMIHGPDLPGLMGPRTLAMLINEAAFAVEAGVASPQDIDTAMCLGTAYPCGPLEWADRVGAERVVALLMTLRESFGERYRPAPWLVRRSVAGWPLGDAPGSSQRWC